MRLSATGFTDALRSPARALSLLLIIAAVQGWAVGDADASQFKRIRDISVRCTNALSCDLFAYNAQSELYTLAFRRGAATDAPVRLVLGVRETLAAGSDVTFEIDGATVLRLPVGDLRYRAAVYEYLYGGEDEIATLIAAAKRGRTLRVSYRARSLDTVSAFSLAGFVDGLAFMDEVQGRAGRADALHGGGPSVGDNEPAVRTISAFSQLPLRLRTEFTNPVTGVCAGLDEGRFATLGGFEAQLDDGALLLGLPCGTGSAENQAYAFWRRDVAAIRRVALPAMSPEGPTTTDTAWNVVWDQENRQLTGLFKRQTAGNCGSYDRWVWRTGAEGDAFVLKESRAKADCAGDVAGGPETWPALWPPEG
ncbi:DUF1176 domain-containing protein [Oricola sp.]|uniref:DUF1176 domain-containing protein n=1 Tax=Oricola sp. TaxID=1979950 RepID=UPI003BABCD39